MSVVLYRPGNINEIDGVPCELKVFTIDNFKRALKNGWYKSVKDFPKAESKEEIPKKETVTKKAKKTT
jgi:hypothetical protein